MPPGNPMDTAGNRRRGRLHRLVRRRACPPSRLPRLREDKSVAEVVMELPDPEAERREMRLTDGVTGTLSRSRWKGAVPPVARA